MANVTITGKVVRCELKNRAPYRPSYYCPGEQLEFYLDLAIETEEGTVYLKSPAAMRNVTTGGPIGLLVNNTGADIRGPFEDAIREANGEPLHEAIRDLFNVHVVEVEGERRLIVDFEED